MGRVNVDRRFPGVALVSLAGEHELYDAPELDVRLELLISEGLAIVIDLTESAFLDSLIVGVLIHAHKLATAKGVDYSVVLGRSTGESIRRMFEVTGLAAILPIVERDAALPRLDYSSSEVSSPGSRFSSGGSTNRA